MSTVKDVARMYDAFASLKALKTPVKIELKVSGRLVLLLAMAVEQGLSGDDPGNLLRKIVPEEDRAGLLELAMEMLKKGELEEFYEKLKS